MTKHKIRNFFFLGFLCGLGIWTHFLIIFYLPPIFLLFFIKDKWFWGRRTILFFLLGLILGGLPLWVHNITHPLVTWHYLLDTSGGGESFLTSLKDFFLYRFPEILGVRNNETNKFCIPYFSFALYTLYLALFLFLLLSRRKSFLNLLKLKISQSNGLDLLLLFLLSFSRYFLPERICLGPYLPVSDAVIFRSSYPVCRLIQKNKVLSLTLAFLFLVLHLFSNVYGTLTGLSAGFKKPRLANTKRPEKMNRIYLNFSKKKILDRFIPRNIGIRSD